MIAGAVFGAAGDQDDFFGRRVVRAVGRQGDKGDQAEQRDRGESGSHQ